MTTQINLDRAQNRLRRAQFTTAACGAIGELTCMYFAMCAPIIRAIKIAPGAQRLGLGNVFMILAMGVALYYIDCKWADNAQKIKKKINQVKSIRTAKGYKNNGR